MKTVAALSRCNLEIQLAAICGGRDPDTATCPTRTWEKQDVRPSSEVRGGGGVRWMVGWGQGGRCSLIHEASEASWVTASLYFLPLSLSLY